MNNTNGWEGLVEQFVAGTLSPEEAQQLALYVDRDAACARAMQEAEALHALLQTRPRPEPPAAYWDGYYDRLVDRMARETLWTQATTGLRESWGRLTAWRAPVWALQGVAAVLLLAVGVWMGRSLNGPPAGPAQPQPNHTTTGTAVLQPAEIQPAALQARQYLNRSKILLLGLVNVDAGAVQPAMLNLPRQREMARGLLQDAEPLRNALDEAGERRLRELVGDLEVILLQIANLEADADVPAIEMVQSGVEQKSLLLKINLEELRQGVSDL